MNTKIVSELKDIARDQDLHGYYKLKKVDLIALLESTEEIPTPP